jgi:hypothetical protein
MRNLLILCLGLFILLAAAPAAAQTAPSILPEPGLGVYWLVRDNSWDGVWIRQGDGSQFEAYWSLNGEDDISAALTIKVKGKAVTIERVDPPNKWNVERCSYTGEFQPDGVTVNGSVDCHFTTGETGTYYWSATVVYAEPLAIDWGTTAVRHRAAKGHTFDFLCPPSGSFSSLWGTDLYTDDSSICTAAVHTGMITTVGGVVTVEIAAGQERYEASTNNGVTSNSYGAWRASYRLAGAAAITPRIGWGDYAMQYRGQNGKTYTFECLPQNGGGRVWGSGIYTDDSAICVAAAYEGIIGSGGGLVTIEILPGQDSYASGERNGISTRSYGAWGGSYRFV